MLSKRQIQQRGELEQMLWKFLAVSSASLMFCSCLIYGTVGEIKRKAFTRIVPITTQRVVEIENSNGSFIVHGERSQVLRLTAEEYAPTAEILRGVRVLVNVDSSSIRFQPEYPKPNGFMGLWWQPSSPGVSFEITMPDSIDVKLHTINGNIDIDGLNNKISVRTGNGNIEIKGLGSEVSAYSWNGGVKLAGTCGNVDAKASNGNIYADLVPKHSCDHINLTTSNGSIYLRIDPLSVGELIAKTGYGGIEIDLPPKVVTESTRDIELKLSDANTRLELRTGFGSIRVAALQTKLQE